MRWTWDYLGSTRTLHDDSFDVWMPGTQCCLLRVAREVDTAMPPNKNELEDRVQQSAGRVWLFNYLDARVLKLTLGIFGKEPGSIGAEDLVTAKRILCQWFNPQPSAPDGVLTFVGHDGVVRAINARYDRGLEGDWLYTDQGEYITDAELLCADPLWYDPELQQASWAQSGDESLVLCYELPYTLCSGAGATQIVVNAGDWATYPIITVTGPAQDVTVQNITTGETIAATYQLLAGQTATYDLRPGVKTIFDSTGTNLMPYLVQPNDLASFHLACAYEYNDAGALVAPGGLNTISISSTTTAMSAVMTWYNRYLSN